MSTPVWLMDVDGVLNAVADADPPTWDRWAVEVAEGYSIRFSPELLDRVSRLVDAREVEVRWLTTWWDRIPALPFRSWHGYPVACTEEDLAASRFGDSWWKLAVAQRLHEPGRRLVWTDDDIALDPSALEWAAAHPEVLAISPEPGVGLTPADVDRVEAFLRG